MREFQIRLSGVMLNDKDAAKLVVSEAIIKIRIMGGTVRSAVIRGAGEATEVVDVRSSEEVLSDALSEALK